MHVLLLQHGDIETNPGPTKEKIKNLSCCHWNVNSLIAHNFKISPLEAYNAIHQHGFICISETFFDSSVTEGDKNIELNGYNLIRADHPSNTKRGGVCIFYKETLALHIVNSLNFNECIVCEVSIQNSKGYIGVIYRSPSQNTIEFEHFLSDFEKLLNYTTSNNGLFTIILGEYNLDLQSGGLKIKQQLKAHNLNLLQMRMGFTNLYHNTFIVGLNLHLALT